MWQKMSSRSRQEVLEHCIDEYNQSSWLEKRGQLDHIVKLTGYARKYVIRLLNQNAAPAAATERRGRPPRYGEPVIAELVKVWEFSGCICSKRLVPFLPTLLSALERFGHISPADDVRELLLSLSTSTADRLLADARAAKNRGLSTTQPNRFIRNQIALRTHNGWNDVVPGYFEADLVAHCGGRVSGSYLYTLDLTDIVTGWTECFGLSDRRAETVVSGIKRVRARLPFELLGLDTDNGAEFINQVLLDYCSQESIEFTRSRAYKKNDQAHIEERNGSVVRRLIGYDRYDGEQACTALNNLYRFLRLHQNYYQPSLRLMSKERDGSHVTKRYDRAQTPLQRLLGSDVLDASQADYQRSLFVSLDPVQLLAQLNKLQDRFWTFAWSSSAVESVYTPAIQEYTAEPSLTAIEGPQCVEPADVSQVPTIRKVTKGKAITRRPLQSVGPTSEKSVGPTSEKSVGPTSESVKSATKSDLKAPRDYRSTRKPIKEQAYGSRGFWYSEIWDEIDQILYQNPYLSAERLLWALQEHHPGRFHERQIRSLRRCVSQWRHAHPEYAKPDSREGKTSMELSRETKARRAYKEGFNNIWEDIKAEFVKDPHQSVNSLFSALQRRFPGRFRDEQVGTFRTRLGYWRSQNPDYKKPSLTPFR